jgi:hypothetical protein
MKDLTAGNFRNNPPHSGWLRMNQLPIGRTLALDLIKVGHLKSVIVAGPGSKRGVRLIELASLEEYFASLPPSLPHLIKRGKLALKKTPKVEEGEKAVEA